MRLVAAANAFDFTTFDYSMLAWKRLVLATRMHERQLVVAYAKTKLLVMSSALAAADVEYDKRVKLVQNELDTYLGSFLPWLSSQTGETDHMLDDIARWYAVMAPDAPVES
jgi:hypothetical protein